MGTEKMDVYNSFLKVINKKIIKIIIKNKEGRQNKIKKKTLDTLIFIVS
jgi:hypothetical protein